MVNVLFERYFVSLSILVLLSACSAKEQYRAKEDEGARFSESYRTALREDFDRVDQNGDGRLSSAEIEAELDRLFKNNKRDSQRKRDEFMATHQKWLKEVMGSDLQGFYRFYKMDSKSEAPVVAYKCPEKLSLPGVKNQGIQLIPKTHSELKEVFDESGEWKARYGSFEKYLDEKNSSWSVPTPYFVNQVEQPPILDRRENISFDLVRTVLGKTLGESFFLKAEPFALFCEYSGEDLNIQIQRALPSRYCELNSDFRPVTKIRRPGIFAETLICEGARPETCRLVCNKD